MFEGDELWNCSDDELVALGTKELATIGLVEPSDVEAGYVVRMPKAYPVYDEVYRDNVEVIRRWFEEHAPNVHPVGRTACTSTTTRTTPCTRPCSRSRTSTAPTTTSGRSTSKRSTTRRTTA